MKLTLACLALVSLPAFAVQDRAKKATAADVPKLLEAAGKAYEAKRFGACARDLRSALGLVAAQVRTQLLAAMPPAPAGYTAQADAADENVAGNPFAQALGMMAAPAERTYRKEDGSGELRIAITPDTPMAAMLAMTFNMAGMDKNAEVVTYKENKAILREEENRTTMQILVGGKDLIDVTADGLKGDALLKVIDQAFVDRVVAALAN